MEDTYVVHEDQLTKVISWWLVGCSLIPNSVVTDYTHSTFS